MMNKKLISTLALTVLGVNLAIPAASAVTDYPSATEGKSTVEAEIILGDEETIPPINPVDPNPPVDPVNPDRGEGLSIRYISSLDFGKTNFSSQAQQLTAAPDSGTDENDDTVEFENMVTVEDIRGVRDGWTLSVAQTADLMDGATLTMNPNVATNQLGVTVGSSTLVVDSENKIFASADNEGAGMAGIISLGMGDVTLDIPANTGLGTYETTLDWTLTSGPLAP